MASYADIPASTVPAATGKTTRWFALDDRHHIRAQFRQRVAGSSYGYAGWDAVVSVYRLPEFHVRGVADRRYLPDGGETVTVPNTGGVCPTVAQITEAARAFVLDDPPLREIAAHRQRLGLTQEQFADRLNAEVPGLSATRQQVTRWESGAQDPHPATMEIVRRMG